MKPLSRAFTLVEIMVATTIFGIASIGLFMLLLSMLKMYAFNSAQLSLIADVRKLTSELTQNAEFSNYFAILPNFTTRTVVEGSVTKLAAVTDGTSGNCLVLVYKDPANNAKISRVMGYYWIKNSTGADGTLYRFNMPYSPSVTGNVWDLMPATSTSGTHPVVADHVLPVTSVFYNFYNRSIITNCQIQEKATNYKNATITYNFTVSPRG